MHAPQFGSRFQIDLKPNRMHPEGAVDNARSYIAEQLIKTGLLDTMTPQDSFFFISISDPERDNSVKSLQVVCNDAHDQVVRNGIIEGLTQYAFLVEGKALHTQADIQTRAAVPDQDAYDVECAKARREMLQQLTSEDKNFVKYAEMGGFKRGENDSLRVQHSKGESRFYHGM